jgi:hypothetical protein
MVFFDCLSRETDTYALEAQVKTKAKVEVETKAKVEVRTKTKVEVEPRMFS